MIKVGDIVKYVGPINTHRGRSCGKVIMVKNEHIAVVKWPRLSEPLSHSISALSITNQDQAEPTTVGHEDIVRKPSHYQVFDGVESIEIIARSMTMSEFRGFCMGNVLKYRLRAGKKSELATMEKDLNKAAFYQELFDLHKGKCYAAE
uniref:Nucleotide kinase n=1 Tax=Escherichia phage Baskent_phicoli_1 TaxID=3145031 RepID=A0AAU8B8R1_9CAUD